jgi:hypothetical protein
MNYSEFKQQNFKRAVATANKIYGYKTLDLTNYESHVKEYAEDICKGWHVEHLMAGAEYVG